MSHSVSSDVLKAMRESYALTRELGLPNMTSEYWSNLLESGRQDYGGKGDFIADDELWGRCCTARSKSLTSLCRS